MLLIYSDNLNNLLANFGLISLLEINYPGHP